MNNKKNEGQVISGKVLLRSVGVLGMALPVLMIIASFSVCKTGDILSSLSHYYHTDAGIVFVATLCIVAFAFYAYRGYSKTDNYLAYAVTLFAVGVAFFPTSSTLRDVAVNDCLTEVHENGWISLVHFTSAACLFGVFAVFCLVQFKKSSKTLAQIKGTRKETRNRIYTICGWLIVACVVLLALYHFFIIKKYPHLQEMDVTFWCEFVGMWAFGFAWLVKGEIIFKDKD